MVRMASFSRTLANGSRTAVAAMLKTEWMTAMPHAVTVSLTKVKCRTRFRP